MGEKLYYVFKIIKEAREPISAKDILKRLENYEIFLDIKTVYSLIKKLNDFYYCLSNKQLIKTIRRRGYIIDEDFFEDGQLQLLIDSVLFNPNLDKKSANDLVNKLALISSVIQMERLNTEHQNDNELTYDLLSKQLITTKILLLNILVMISKIMLFKRYTILMVILILKHMLFPHIN